MGTPPVRFAFALHLHQPVGNFDFVFQEHVEEVYRPLLSALHEYGTYPLTLHISGPLLDWLAEHGPAFLDEIGTRVADGQVELLASGRTEPILAALDPDDRVHQVEAMREILRARFGVQATGLWLTERVWEQDLSADLARAGIEYTLLDDRHFMAAGHEQTDLDGPFRTESGGRPLTVLPIDERLRYLIPFRPVTEIETFFEARHAEGTRAIVLGDDGEKFGGWPDTRAWVYDEGWLDDFLRSVARLCEADVIELVTTGDVARGESCGLTYPAPGSYREMEEWTLPRPAALRIEALWANSDKEMEPHLRGGHWKGFLRKYPEANRMHKATLQLSRLCRQRGDPIEARSFVQRAQCNDAYWHGVFGGVYLPHLRGAVWRELACAEAALRTGEPLSFEVLDWDLDGDDEVWVHSSQFSAVISPRRGGAIESLTYFSAGANLVDVLSRRLEPYHADPSDAPSERSVAASGSVAANESVAASEDDPVAGIVSVHDRSIARPVPPALDPYALALFQEHVGGVEPDTLLRFELEGAPSVDGLAIVVDLRSTGDRGVLLKRYRFDADGNVDMSLTWTPTTSSGPGPTTSLVLAFPVSVESEPAASVSHERIITLARSERGFEHVDQGERVELSWPSELGSASVRLRRPA